MKRKIEAIIFDLDGVVVDTASFHFKAWSRLADKLDISFSEHENEKLKGVSRIKSMEILLQLGNIKLPESEKAKLCELKNNWYLQYVAGITPSDILPGVKAFLNEVVDAGIKTAIATASKNGKTVINQLKLDGIFNVIVDGNMIERTKPNPEIFLKAAQMLHTLPGNCLVFEDAVAGIRAAGNAGMMCVGVGKQEVLKEADFVVSNFRNFSLVQLYEWYSIPNPQV